MLVERRVKAPLLDLNLLRNSVLVGATLSILLGSGTINAIMAGTSAPADSSLGPDDR